MTSEDSFIPIGKIIRGKYIYKNAHYDCVRKADEDKTYENESKFDWQGSFLPHKYYFIFVLHI